MFLPGCAINDKTQNNNTINSEAIVITYETETTETNNTLSEAMMESIKSILTKRFNCFGYDNGDIVFSTVEKQIQVKLSQNNAEIQQIAEIVGQPNKFKIIGPNNEIILTEKDIESVKSNQVNLDIQFNDEGTKILSEATEKFMDETVTVYLDNTQLDKPRIVSPIKNGTIVIPGYSTIQRNDILAKVLNVGEVLPFQLKLISIESKNDFNK